MGRLFFSGFFGIFFLFLYFFSALLVTYIVAQPAVNLLRRIGHSIDYRLYEEAMKKNLFLNAPRNIYNGEMYLSGQSMSPPVLPSPPPVLPASPPMYAAAGGTYYDIPDVTAFPLAKTRYDRNKNAMRDATVAYQPPSLATCQRLCRNVYYPVCASNGVTYNNECEYDVARCLNHRLKILTIGFPCKTPKNDSNNNNSSNNNNNNNNSDNRNNNNIHDSTLSPYDYDIQNTSHLFSPPPSPPPLPLPLSPVPSSNHPLYNVNSIYNNNSVYKSNNEGDSNSSSEKSNEEDERNTPSLSGQSNSNAGDDGGGLLRKQSVNLNENSNNHHMENNHFSSSFPHPPSFSPPAAAHYMPSSPIYHSSSSPPPPLPPPPLPIGIYSPPYPFISNRNSSPPPAFPPVFAGYMPSSSVLPPPFLPPPLPLPPPPSLSAQQVNALATKAAYTNKNIVNTNGCTFACQHSLNPVCGNDGITYGSKCLLEKEACVSRRGGPGGLYVHHEGACKDLDEEATEELKHLNSLAISPDEAAVLDGQTVGESLVNKITYALKARSSHANPLSSSHPHTHPSPLISSAASSSSKSSSREHTEHTEKVNEGNNIHIDSINETDDDDNDNSNNNSDNSNSNSNNNNYNDNNYDNNSFLSNDNVTEEISSSPSLPKACNTKCPSGGPAVCATNGMTYTNMCELHAYACLSNHEDVTIAHIGTCENSSAETENPPPTSTTTSTVRTNTTGNFSSSSTNIKKEENKGVISLPAISLPSPPPIPSSIPVVDSSSSLPSSSYSYSSSPSPSSSSSFSPIKRMGSMREEFKMGNGYVSKYPVAFTPNPRLAKLGNSFSNAFTVSELSEIKAKAAEEAEARENGKGGINGKYDGFILDDDNDYSEK